MANRKALLKAIFGGIAGRLLDNGDGSFAPLVATAPGVLAARASGSAASPVAATILCDTGALPAGDYRVEIELGSTDPAAVGKTILVAHRNAGNTANVHIEAMPTPLFASVVWSRVTLAANERVRTQSGNAAAAVGAEYYAQIRAYALS